MAGGKHMEHGDYASILLGNCRDIRQSLAAFPGKIGGIQNVPEPDLMAQ